MRIRSMLSLGLLAGACFAGCAGDDTTVPDTTTAPVAPAAPTPGLDAGAAAEPNTSSNATVE